MRRRATNEYAKRKQIVDVFNLCDAVAHFVCLFLCDFSDGWERLALYEYYKVKNAARKVKEEEINDGAREKSRSPSPIVIEVGKTAAPNKRRYR